MDNSTNSGNSIPVIDFGCFRRGCGNIDSENDNENNKLRVALEIRNACENVGFFYATGFHHRNQHDNHDNDNNESIVVQRAMESLKSFFDVDVSGGSDGDDSHDIIALKQEQRKRQQQHQLIKDGCSSYKSPLFRGYTRCGGGNSCVPDTDSHIELKESFTVGAENRKNKNKGNNNNQNNKSSIVIKDSPLHGPNNWPSALSQLPVDQQEQLFCPTTFRNDMESCYEEMLDRSKVIAKGLALSLALNESYFIKKMSNPAAQMVGFKYPPTTQEEQQEHKQHEKLDIKEKSTRNKDEQQQSSQPSPKPTGCGAHTDCGFLTLLVQSSNGLEVQDLITKQWRSAPPKHSMNSHEDYYGTTILVNLGDLTEFWTNGKYKSTPHRVENKSQTDNRYSIAFFANCDFYTPLHPLNNVDAENEKDKDDDTDTTTTTTSPSVIINNNESDTLDIDDDDDDGVDDNSTNNGDGSNATSTETKRNNNESTTTTAGEYIMEKLGLMWMMDDKKEEQQQQKKQLLPPT